MNQGDNQTGLFLLKRGGTAGFLILLFFFFSLCACTSRNRTEGYIYYRLASNPSTLDPALIVDVAGGSISAKLFNGLVKIDEGLKIIPDLAEKWTISKDGLSYKFYFKKNIKFSNNREVTADDFKYSFKRVLNPKTRSPNVWVFEKIAGAKDYMEGRTDDVSGIRTPGRYVLEIRLENPFSPFLYLLTMPAAYVVPEEEIRKSGPDFSNRPVGTGPFTLNAWLPNREIRLEQRPDYFDARPKIKGIIYRIIPEDLTAITEFENGNLDLLAVPTSEISRYREDSGLKKGINIINGINTYYLGMNCSRPPFDNITLRKAVTLAIDRKKLLETFYEKRGRLASGPVPDVLRKWDPPAVYEFNPQKARELIAEEKLAGLTINFYVTADQEVVDMAEFIQAYIRAIGLNVRIKQLEWSAYKEAVNKGEADMFWLSWWADYPDSENFLYPLFHSSNIGPSGNRSRYKNHEVDKLIDKGRAAMDEKARAEYYAKAERLIVSEAPWVFFWHKNDYMAVQPWLKNYRAYPIYTMDKGTKINLEH